MQYRPLGRTGVQVSSLCLGTMMLGAWGNRDLDECVRMVHAALDAGVNLVDTADVYAAGESEEIVGRALQGRRDRVVLATKLHNPMGDDPNQRGNSRRWILEAVEGSLRRLRTDHIDLYQLHRPDTTTDPEDSLSALDSLVRAGKVRYVGTSTFPAHLLVELQWAAERRNLERPACEQPPYSILARGIERDVLPTCRRHGMGVIVYSPLAGGWLTGKYRAGEAPPEGSRGTIADHGLRWDPRRPENRSSAEAVDRLAPLAREHGITLPQLALAWVTEHPAVTSAIIGPRTMEQLEASLTAADVRLSSELLDAVDTVVPPGVNLNPADAGWDPPSLTAAERRRPQA